MMNGYQDRMRQQLSLVSMLDATGQNTYAREVSSSCGPTMVVEGRECVNFISNSYMGFSIHPRVIEAVKKTAEQYGMGIGGSPLACGTTSLHMQLAEVLADNYGTESALVFATGYQALAGTIQGLMTRKDMALLDSLCHRSIIDGCALSGCKIRSFKHNDPSDLRELVDSTASGDRHRMVVVDSVYSMDGDVAPLPELLQICKPAGVTVLIDEAHSLGVMGKTGRGLLEHFGIESNEVVISGTFSKFAGAVGGFTAGDRDLVEYLRYYSSPYVFSAALPPVVVSAVLTSFSVLRDEPEWLERLWKNVETIRTGLQQLGFDTGSSSTPCIPILVRDTEKVLRMVRRLLDEGVYASPVIHPGVPLRQERVRLGVMASHTREHLTRTLDVFEKVGKEFELI